MEDILCEHEQSCVRNCNYRLCLSEDHEKIWNHFTKRGQPKEDEGTMDLRAEQFRPDHEVLADVHLAAAGIDPLLQDIAHEMFVRPKLSRKPSQIMNDQVFASFQNERTCITTIDRPGGKNIMWGSDYPHAEGTWPNSRRIQDSLFAGLGTSEAVKADVLGLNAARLFRIDPVNHTVSG